MDTPDPRNNEFRVAAQSIVERIEAIRESKRQCSADEAEVAAEAKTIGISRKALNAFLKERAEDRDAADALDAEVDVLRRVFGMSMRALLWCVGLSMALWALAAALAIASFYK